MMTEVYGSETPNADQPNVENQPPVEPTIQIPDEVLALVGPGKKYATLADALKSIPHAQGHIQTLESELAQLREEKGKALSQEEVYAAVQDYLKQNGGQAGTGLDEKAVDGLLDRKLKEREEAERQQANITTFKSAMGKFGDEAKQREVFNAKAAELGMTPQRLSALVAESPKAVMTMFGLDGKQPSGNPPPRGLNTEALSTTVGSEPPRQVNTRSVKDLTAEFVRLQTELKKKHGIQ